MCIGNELYKAPNVLSILLHILVTSELCQIFNISFSYYFQTERDVSVRQRAVDLLYAMCDKNNAEEIVSEMLTYLETADYSIKEEMVISFIIFFKFFRLQNIELFFWFVKVVLAVTSNQHFQIPIWSWISASESHLVDSTEITIYLFIYLFI